MILRQQKISKEFYRNFFSLYFVLVLQNVVTLSVNLTDNIMLGAYSETALSGVSAVNQITDTFVFLAACYGAGRRTGYFLQSVLGKETDRAGEKDFRHSDAGGRGHSLLSCLRWSVFFRTRQSIFSQLDEAIIQQGMEYLNIIRFTYLFFANDSDSACSTSERRDC